MGISYYFEFLRQLKVLYSKTENPNSADLFSVHVVKIGAKIQNNKKYLSIGYFLLCLVFSVYSFKKAKENTIVICWRKQQIKDIFDKY